MKKIFTLMLLCTAFLFTSCDEKTEPETTLVAAQSVKLDKTTLSLIVAAKETLRATVTPENATNKAVTWSTNDKAIATVSETGEVTALKEGKATITVTTVDGGKTAKCEVTITKMAISVSGIALNKKTLSLKEGVKETLTTTVTPENATNKKMTWKSNKTDVATVSVTGEVAAVKEGKATITVTTEDGGKTATCEVTVTKNESVVTGITLNKTTLSLASGTKETLNATVTPENATNKNVTWSSSDQTVATVSTKGEVTAIKAGNTTITVTTEDGAKTATCQVTVTSETVAVINLSLYKTTLILTQDTKETLVAVISPTNATNKNVVWSSSDPTVASVSAEGEVSALKEGKTTVTVTAVDNGKTAKCEVEVVKAGDVTEVILDQTAVKLSERMTVTLVATVFPDNAANKSVTWKSSNPAIASVSSAGLVTGIALGETTVTATSVSSPAQKAECIVTVTRIRGI